MRFSSSIVDEVWDDRTPQLFAITVLMWIVIRVLAPGAQRRIRTSVALFGLHLATVPVAGILRATESTLYRETHLAALAFAVFAVIGMGATVVFSVAAPRMRLRVPRILEDIVVASAFVVAIFALASRAGVNLSGLIATSAVLTAVVGLAFQETLGNVVGGLTLQLDASINVGDWIQVGQVSGRVTEIRWRYTAVETRDWETVILPNSFLVKNQVTVLARRAGARALWRRTVRFNIDFRHPPSEVIDAVDAALANVTIANVATEPRPECVLLDLAESYGRYAVRYWLSDPAVDDPTDGLVRTRVYFALRRKGISLSMPAHAVFLTEDSVERREHKTREDLERRTQALARVDVLGSLSAEERAQLATSLRFAPFTRGETIMRQGADAQWLYMMIEGEAVVRVAVDGPHGGALRDVARLGPSDFFGEMSLLTGEPRSATVIAVTDVACYRLDKEAFRELMERRPELAEQVADILAERRVALDAARENLDLESKKERLSTTRSDLLGKIRFFFALDDRRNSAAS